LKKFLLYICLTIIAAVSGTVSAQVKTGYIWGINISSVSLKTTGNATRPERLPGLHFGGLLEYSFTRHISIQPAILFSAKGSNFKIDTLDLSLSPAYVVIPLDVVFKLGNETANLAFSVGPYIGGAFGGYKIESGGELKHLKFGKDRTSDLKRFDTGINIGAGLYSNGFKISAQYELGLMNVAPDGKMFSELKNKVLSFSIMSVFTPRRSN
jgi:hypothetical protein